MFIGMKVLANRITKKPNLALPLIEKIAAKSNANLLTRRIITSFIAQQSLELNR